MTAFLKLLEPHVYAGLEPTRGPWSTEHCHAGPPAGAIARSIEMEAGAEKLLTRLTLDLIRPIPMAGFRVSVEVEREGRKTSIASATLADLNGKPCVTASALLIAPSQELDMPTADAPKPQLSSSTQGQFPLADRTAHELPAFGSFVDVRYPEGQTPEPGPTQMWMKTKALIEGETPSSFQRICPLCDCGNATSRNAELKDITFVNPDLTIVMHRQTSADWFLSDAVSHWRRNGIGLAEARIFDEDGPVATAMQSLILTPAKR